MSKHSTPYQVSPTNPDIQEIQTKPERRVDMPYAPAMRVTGGGDLLFVSGATPSPLYHKHPHDWSEHDHPVDIREQARRALASIREILDHEGLTWTDVVKVTKYLTDMRDQERLSAVLQKPSATGLQQARRCVSTSSPRPARASRSK